MVLPLRVVIRTVQLLRYLTDPQMRRRVTAATNKVEAYNGFSEWVRFGNRGVITDNDPVEQEKAVKFNALLTNCLTFRSTLDIAEAVRALQAEGWKVGPEDLAEVSSYLTERICASASAPLTNWTWPRGVRVAPGRRLHQARPAGPGHGFLRGPAGKAAELGACGAGLPLHYSVLLSTGSQRYCVPVLNSAD